MPDNSFFLFKPPIPVLMLAKRFMLERLSYISECARHYEVIDALIIKRQLFEQRVTLPNRIE